MIIKSPYEEECIPVILYLVLYRRNVVVHAWITMFQKCRIFQMPHVTVYNHVYSIEFIIQLYEWLTRNHKI